MADKDNLGSITFPAGPGAGFEAGDIASLLSDAAPERGASR